MNNKQLEAETRRRETRRLILLKAVCVDYHTVIQRRQWYEHNDSSTVSHLRTIHSEKTVDRRKATRIHYTGTTLYVCSV